MKSIIFAFFIFTITQNVFSQVAGTPIKGYYFADNRDSFNLFISKEYKIKLDEFLKSENIDSSNCEFLTTANENNAFLVKNLDTVSYKYIIFSGSGNNITKKVYDNPRPNKSSRRKIMIYYGKNEKEKIEVLSINYIY